MWASFTILEVAADQQITSEEITFETVTSKQNSQLLADQTTNQQSELNSIEEKIYLDINWLNPIVRRFFINTSGFAITKL